MTFTDRIVSTTLAVSLACLALSTAHAQVSVVVMEGDSPPGAAGGLVSVVDNPMINSQGEVGFVGVLTNNDHFVWVGDDIVWLGSSAVGYTLSLPTSQRYTMGLSDTGSWVYWPDVNGQDSIWTDNGLLVQRLDAAPDYIGAAITAIYRATMLPSGEIVWLANIDTNATPTTTEGRALFITPDGTMANTTRLLSTGDVFDGLALDIYGVDYDFAVSQNGGHYIAVVDLATGETLFDAGVIVDGVLVAREGLTGTNTSDFLDNFDLVAINNAGNFLISGDSDGNLQEDEFIVYNGTVGVREGMTIDGITLTSSSYVDGIALNNHNAAAHAWQVGATDTLFYATDAANLAGSSRVILTEGDFVDIDGDGIGDYMITDFNTSSLTGSGLVLTDSGIIYTEVDLDTDGNGVGDAEAMLRIIPSICGDGVVAGTEQCDDGAESSTCNANCTFPYCGDMVTNMAAGEDCDDGGVETATCDADCTAPLCGDGIWNMLAGEVCDTGEETAECDIDCTVPECGDMVTNMTAGEDCDDGGVNTAACNADCTASVCGDGVWNMESGEVCDDGPESVTCDSDCTAPMCGDLVVNMAAGEDCDDGAINTEACDQDCTAAECGDGYLNLVAGEECDSGGESASCDSDCTRVSCGDGVVNSAVGEECDGGGESADCNRNCTAVECGDTIINTTAGETCDDGNARDGDGCSATCRIEDRGGSDGCSCTVGDARERDPLAPLAGFSLFFLALVALRRRRVR